MQYRLLPWILGLEGNSFKQVDNRWRPTGLLTAPQARAILMDMRDRYKRLSSATDELQTLNRAPRYIKLLQRMRLWIRLAAFSWKADHLRFIQAVADFYGDYGTMLRFLKFEQFP